MAMETEPTVQQSNRPGGYDGGIYCLYRYYGVFAAAAVANDNNVIRLHFEIISVQSGSGWW